jgi:VWFA-related protein
MLLMLAAVMLAGDTAIAQNPASSQQPVFRSNVTLVTTDVIPRDPNGRFVSDLTKDNFTVLEDGQPQTITSFSLVHGGRTFTSLTPPPAAAVEGIVVPGARPPMVADGAGRVLLIFVDDFHFEPEYSPHVRRLIETIAATLLHDGDLIAMVSSGPSAIEVGPTYDRKLVVSAVSKIRGSGLTAAEIFKMLETSQGPADVRSRAQIAFYTAYNMVTSAEEVQNKRKVLLYVSTGYDFDPFAEGRNSSDRIMGGRFSDPLRSLIDKDNPYFSLASATADIDLYKLMRELTLAANRANVSIFTIDPRGVAGVVDAGQYIDQSEWRTFFQKTQSSLRFMAEETGGQAVVNDNDFASALKRIDAETSDYYVIGYYSTNSDSSKRVRELDVKVDRPNVTVASRRAYSIKTPGKPVSPVKVKK